jgi:riboflavin synthase alpha subunit
MYTGTTSHPLSVYVVINHYKFPLLTHSHSSTHSHTPIHRYIAIDGTSLTVCEVNRTEGWFTFMLIAYTQKHVIIPHKAVGDK